jgi:tRNA threonylcarbamoyladenosine biosynthesis protein TsaE
MAKNKKSNIRDISIFDKNTFITKTPQETRNLGKKFASVLKRGDIVFLKGGLGSGKTTFVQGIVKAFGNKGFARSSSFTIIKEYNAAGRKLFHMDLYRLKAPNIRDMGIEEYLYGKNISLIEWADRLTETKNDSHWDVEIENINSKRKIRTEKKK